MVLKIILNHAIQRLAYTHSPHTLSMNNKIVPFRTLAAAQINSYAREGNGGRSPGSLPGYRFGTRFKYFVFFLPFFTIATFSNLRFLLQEVIRITQGHSGDLPGRLLISLQKHVFQWKRERVELPFGEWCDLHPRRPVACYKSRSGQ